MGLLSSFFQRRSEPEGETPIPGADRPAGGRRSEALWRCGVFESYPVGEHVQAAYRTGETPRIFPSYAIEFVLNCSKFLPLKQHVAEYAELHRWDSLQVEALEKLLPELHEAGLLVSTTDVLNRAASESKSTESAPPPIRFIGFPTGGDRVALLERALRSFAENVRSHQRSVDFLVADSSSRPEHSAAFRQSLAALEPELGFPILYSGPEEKRRFATALVQAGACAMETAEFALLDPLGTGFACGANRNALLLHGAGEMICSVDDDIVCRLAAPLDEENGVACFSNTDPFSRWLFGDRESAWDAARWVEGNFIGIHEQMLGRSLGGILQSDSPEIRDFRKAGGSFLRRVRSETGFIRATFFGHVGDPGIPTSAYYLYFDGENRSRLTKAEEHYRNVFPSRSVHTLVSRPSVGDASVSPGMAIGIDNRTLLPPFIPVLHAEDFAWGAALWQCCGDAFLGHVPFAIQHDPGPGKGILLPSDFTESRRVVIFELAHLLRLFILNFEPPQQQQPAERIMALGTELLNYAKLDPRDFSNVLAELILEHVSSKLSWLEKQLSEDNESPDFWREDVQAHIDHVREALTYEDFDIPFDLKPGRTPAEARALIQTLLGHYGHLLQAWPAMVEASADLKQRGEGLFRRIG